MILGLVTDLFFVSRIQSAALKAGLAFEALDIYKTMSEFVEILAEKKPDLIVLDLNSALPWPEWLPAAKADQRFSAIPWLAFGSHMNPRRLAAARHAGADKVVPKSQFATELDESIRRLVKQKETR